MVRTQIQFTKSQIGAIRKLSEKHSSSMAETIRRAVERITDLTLDNGLAALLTAAIVTRSGNALTLRSY
jgi:hypothetical protein